MITKKSKQILLLILLGMILSFSIVNAFFEDSVSVTNHIAMGDVNIGITEYEIKNGREVIYENSKMIYPGDVISKIPRIINYGNECWIRVHISYKNDKEAEGFNQENLKGISAEWVKRGDYYYYKKSLLPNASADVFQEVIIPENWDNVHALQKLSIVIQAEAIQAANFQPDFEAMSPWGNQSIELCVHEENGVSNCVKKEMQLSVEFNGAAHKLLAVPNDFFHNIKRAMPGDLYRDEILLFNTTSETAELFFKTSLPELSVNQKKLLEKIELQIEIDKKILYEGNLLSEELKENISLGSYDSGEHGSLNFEIKIPEELNNAYALREADVIWTFSVKEEAKDLSYDNSDSNDSRYSPAVKTGDDTSVLFWLLVIFISITGIITGMIIKRKGVSENEK